MIKSTLRLTTLTCLLFLVLVGCKDDEPTETDNFNRKGMLINLADNIIVPSYEEYQTKLSNTIQSAEAFTASPSTEGLASLRSDFVLSYEAWQTVSLYEFGPAATYTLMNQTNLYPTDTAKINANIANGGYNLDAISNLTAKGLPALDYLINSHVLSDAEIVGLFNNSEAHKTYLNDVLEDLNHYVSLVIVDWNGTYRNTFVNATGSDAGSSLSLMVNAINQYYERVTRDGQIGIPAGVRNIVSNDPEPTMVEAYYKGDISLSNCLMSLSTYDNFLRGVGVDGVDGSGLYDYLEDLGAVYQNQSLAITMMNGMDDNVAAVNAMDSPYYEYVSTNQSTAQDTYYTLKAWGILLKVDMPSAIGVSISYVDNDGD